MRDTLVGGPKLVMGATGTLGTSMVAGSLAGDGPGSGVHSFEVRLVLEYCDRGSLRDALDGGAFRLPAAAASDGAEPANSSSRGEAAAKSSGGSGAAAINYRAVLDTAIDIATAMSHLHGRNVLHSDLKARNIMLKTCGADGRGVTAKVADFGLSVKMDLADTHLSNSFQGTMVRTKQDQIHTAVGACLSLLRILYLALLLYLTIYARSRAVVPALPPLTLPPRPPLPTACSQSHMAPELLVKGHLSKASDVYAFGILLWELATGGHPFRSVPRALLGHQITKLHKRPEFDGGVPRPYAALAARCWDPKPSRR